MIVEQEIEIHGPPEARFWLGIVNDPDSVVDAGRLNEQGVACVRVRQDQMPLDLHVRTRTHSDAYIVTVGRVRKR